MAQEYDMESIGRRLKSGLADNGMTADQLADAIGVSRYTVGEWVMGRRRMKLTDAAKVCDVFGWPLDRLARRERDDFNGAELDMGWAGSGNTEGTYEDQPVPPRGEGR